MFFPGLLPFLLWVLLAVLSFSGLLIVVSVDVVVLVSVVGGDLVVGICWSCGR